MEELERIIEALKNGETTSTDDWQAVAEYYYLVGETDAETITNIEKFVLDNFSIEAAAENPYVYFETDGNANIWQYVDGIVPLYEGTNASGKITLQAANGESVKVQVFNDFFSENYIKGIKSSNVKTIFSGDILARNGEGLNAA